MCGRVGETLMEEREDEEGNRGPGGCLHFTFALRERDTRRRWPGPDLRPGSGLNRTLLRSAASGLWSFGL